MDVHVKSPMCDCNVVHEDAVRAVLERSEDPEVLFATADFLKVMADSTRMRILYALDDAELCVCDLSAALNMSLSAVSHQLKVLKDASLVKYRREGKNVFYSLQDDHVKENEQTDDG